MKKNLTDLYGLFMTQTKTAAIHHQHSVKVLVKVLVGQIAVIECPMIAVLHLYQQMVRVLAGPMIAVRHLYHQMVRVLAEVLIPKSIGFAVIAQLRGLLLFHPLPHANYKSRTSSKHPCSSRSHCYSF